MSYIESAQRLNREVFIHSGVGINKNYIFYNFKFHICLLLTGEHIYIYIPIKIVYYTTYVCNEVASLATKNEKIIHSNRTA